MDARTHYRDIIERVLCEYAEIPGATGGIETVPVFDRLRDRYALLNVGWDREGDRIHGCLVHVDLIGDKCWIQYDGTEDGIAYDLEVAGIPKDHIVLAFQPAYARPHTGYAVA